MLLQVPALAVFFQYRPTQNLTGKFCFGFFCAYQNITAQISLKQMQ